MNFLFINPRNINRRQFKIQHTFSPYHTKNTIKYSCGGGGERELLYFLFPHDVFSNPFEDECVENIHALNFPDSTIEEQLGIQKKVHPLSFFWFKIENWFFFLLLLFRTTME